MDPGGEVMRQVVDAVAAGNGQQLLRDGALLERLSGGGGHGGAMSKKWAKIYG